METASAQAVVETTECSVTCGVGSKTEKRCLVDRSGIQKDCELIRVECLSNWLCGLEAYTLRVGDYFTMDCQIPSTGTLGGPRHYYWKYAAGIITINDIYFRPVKNKNSTTVFESIEEKASGTYRCDVQNEVDLKIVKRIYYGVRIITPGIIDINYNKYLISKQKLASMAKELTNQDSEEKFELYGGIYTYVAIGSAVGILTGILVLVLIRWNLSSRRGAVNLSPTTTTVEKCSADVPA
ncbi:hypothetical protein GDO81_006376 [Engystomops pustulosus]|uniref:Transmembrane protein 81 n=1 Tax=Engystomops pustulosus TaxID=76066 RepID=A0AAV7CXC4_ENGPU|nr:hypothetical protein GDO81_006376 [Engystomops pustulosus]